MKRLAVFAFVLAFAACAPIPRPPVFAEVDAVHDNQSSAEDRKLAPTAYAHADKLRTEARAAFEAGDVAGSQFLAERSLAAYAHALVYARITRAEAEAKAADTALAASQTEVATLDAEQARLAAEVTALEARIRVSKDAQPVSPSGQTSGIPISGLTPAGSGVPFRFLARRQVREGAIARRDALPSFFGNNVVGLCHLRFGFFGLPEIFAPPFGKDHVRPLI